MTTKTKTPKLTKTEAKRRAAIKSHAGAGNRFIREYLRQSSRLPQAR